MLRLTQGVSIIICCYNSEKRLPITLKYIANQQLKDNYPVEVIIVDNNSSDDTSIVARELWDTFGTPFPLTVILEKEPGLSCARRAGVMAAQYEYGLFCDDDNWLNIEYLDTSIELFERNPRVGILGGCSVAISDVDLPPWFFTKAGSFAVGTQSDAEGDITWRYFVWGAGMTFRLNVLRSIYESGVMPLVSDRKGKALTSGGDGEISAWFIFAGYRLYYSDKLLFKHYIPSSRLTDEYYQSFFNQSYPTEWTTYYHYINVKFRLFRHSNGLTAFIRNTLNYSHSLRYLITNIRSLRRIRKAEKKIKYLKLRFNN